MVWWWAVVGAACALGATVTHAATSEHRPPHLLLVVVDTLRADHTSLHGYSRPTTPAITHFFRDGRVFERAYTPVPFTAPSVMSLLTGLVPARHGVRMMIQKLAPDRVTLPERLRQVGYRTGAVVSNMVLTDDATGLGARFDHFDDFVDEPVRAHGSKERPAFERTAARTTDAALAWLGTLKDDAKPHFLWVHYMDPHAPYTAPADAPTFAHERPAPIDPQRIAVASRLADVTDGAEYVDRYDEEIAFADREIGRLLERYTAMFGRENRVIVFTADHGETLMEPGRERWFAHGFNVWEEQARIPLAMIGPGVAPGREHALVSLLDVAPTLLEFAGAGTPGELDGRSLRAPSPDRALTLEGMGPTRGTQYRALRQGTTKWVMYSAGGVEDVAARTRFDLERDPAEGQPHGLTSSESVPESLLTAQRQDPDPSGLPARERLIVGTRLERAKARPADGVGVVSGEASPETVERLRALGYVQ